MAHYAKTFDRIFRSTIWQEDSDTRIVWWTLLLLADQDGKVHSTVPGLAHTARVSMESCVRALERFHTPDRYSSSREFDGRRIDDVDGGWHILNFEKYRDMMSEDEQREKARLRQQRKRERDKEARAVTECHADTPNSHAPSRDVTPSNACNDTTLHDTKLDYRSKADSAPPVTPVTPPGLHPTQYAAKLLEELVMSKDRANLMAVTCAIDLEITQGKSGAAAYEYILARALDARDHGQVLDKFYFVDWGKHRNGPAQERRSGVSQKGADWLKEREERRNAKQ